MAFASRRLARALALWQNRPPLPTACSPLCSGILSAPDPGGRIDVEWANGRMKSGLVARSRAVALLRFFLLLVLFGNVASALATGTIETYVGGGNGDGADAIDATIDPRGFVLVGNPNAPDIYVADLSNHRVRRIEGDTGLIETIAGN